MRGFRVSTAHNNGGERWVHSTVCILLLRTSMQQFDVHMRQYKNFEILLRSFQFLLGTCMSSTDDTHILYIVPLHAAVL
jgi:hypothetical protein